MPTIESLSVKPIVDLYTCISKILKDNKIKNSFDVAVYYQKIEEIMQSIVKVQTLLVN